MASAEETAGNHLRPLLWTAWLDIFSTGEGRSIMACITYACDEPEIREIFAKRFGQWYGSLCDAQNGVARNSCTTFLWTDEALEFIERAGNQLGLVDVHSELHINLG